MFMKETFCELWWLSFSVLPKEYLVLYQSSKLHYAAYYALDFALLELSVELIEY